MEIERAGRLNGPERKKQLRNLQVQWHPDKFFGDDVMRELATEVSVMINEAMSAAKEAGRGRRGTGASSRGPRARGGGPVQKHWWEGGSR